MIRVSKEVSDAFVKGQPVLALESTVIAHGLPRPRNVEVALSIEDDVRKQGVVPATVGVIAGEPVVGLSEREIEHIGAMDGVLKLSTRELPIPVTRGLYGATTVAATMWLARRVGIQVFATGGIGGVHRGELNDVSADLTELSRTPMLVICAGAKSVLDLPATREALETAGVLIVGFRADELPAFYSRGSGIPVDVRVESYTEAAALWRAHRALSMQGAVLVCVPPPDSFALPADLIEIAIQNAIVCADRDGVRGKDLTPFLLREVSGSTSGKSLETNIAVLRNNAAVAAGIAKALRPA